MKKFYTDIDVAKLANRWHGVNYIDKEGGLINNTLNLEVWALSQDLSMPYKIYIHEDSLPIFEPQVGDAIAHKQNFVIYIAQEDKRAEGDLAYINLCAARGSLDSGLTKIIQRDGKPFFWPEVS